MKRLSSGILCVVFLIAPCLSGCVAVWGKSYHVIMKNSEGIMIEYDPGIIGATGVARVAEQEASKIGRVIVPGEKQDDTYAGIRREYFKFVKPER